jgi:hypothetical protein
MGTLLEGQASVAKNQFDTAKAEYDMYSEQVTEKWNKWQNAQSKAEK